MGKSLQAPAGSLWAQDNIPQDNTVDNIMPNKDNNDDILGDRQFIPQVSLHAQDGRSRKRVLILCTGGTLTMAPDATGALAPVEGALSSYLAKNMDELQAEHMPEVVLHEYTPFYDSSDLGPADWVRIAADIRVNYVSVFYFYY